MPGNGSVSFLSFFSILLRLSFTISVRIESRQAFAFLTHLSSYTRESHYFSPRNLLSPRVLSRLSSQTAPPLSLFSRTLWHSALFLLSYSRSIFDPLFLLVALFIPTAHTAGTYSDVSTPNETVCFSFTQKFPLSRSLSYLLAFTGFLTLVSFLVNTTLAIYLSL